MFFKLYLHLSFLVLFCIAFVSASQHKKCNNSPQEPKQEEQSRQISASSENKSENWNYKLEIRKKFEDWITRMKNTSMEVIPFQEDQKSSTKHWINSCLDEYLGKTLFFK